ncbi:MAG: hypothetical protein JST47_01245 [Bacteroidetes bacterium]|nr:hypothetical protein [Bacteroidota bacterium]
MAEPACSYPDAGPKTFAGLRRCISPVGAFLRQIQATHKFFYPNAIKHVFHQLHATSGYCFFISKNHFYFLHHLGLFVYKDKAMFINHPYVLWNILLHKMG